MTSDPSAADISGRDLPAGAVVLPERVGARELELARQGARAFGVERGFEPAEARRDPP